MAKLKNFEQKRRVLILQRHVVLFGDSLLGLKISESKSLLQVGKLKIGGMRCPL